MKIYDGLFFVLLKQGIDTYYISKSHYQIIAGPEAQIVPSKVQIVLESRKKQFFQL